MAARRDTYRYILRGLRDGRVKYAGITNNPIRRALEHGRGLMEVRGPRVRRSTARVWERRYIARVRPPVEQTRKVEVE